LRLASWAITTIGPLARTDICGIVTTQGDLQRYENNYKVLNLITTALGRNVYDRVSRYEIVHGVWLNLCNTYEGYFEIKSSHKDTYNKQYQTFSQKPRESLDD
jgi:hypothetical protein